MSIFGKLFIKTEYESNTDTNAFTDAEKTAVSTNSAKVGNATHTGDVTGATALTIGAKKVTLGMMADGTDGELITYDANGVAAKVAVGTATHVLTSNGVGAAPTFQAAAGGTTLRTIDFNLETVLSSGAATSGFLAATNGYNEYEIQGSGGGSSKIAYFSAVIPADYVSGGDVLIDSWTTDFAGLTTWTATLNINGTVDATINAVDITPTADTTYQTSSDTAGSTIAAGDTIQLRLNFTGSNGDDIRIRRVSMDYTGN
jgi:hypothetical protein